MLSYTRGILVAYRDVLNVIDAIEVDGLNQSLELLRDHIENRIDKYLEHQIPEEDID